MEPIDPGEDRSFSDVQDDLDKFNKIQSTLSRLIGKNKGEDNIQVFHINSEGGIPTDEMLSLFEGKKMIDAAKAHAGDVVWWKSASGTTGYFLILKENENDEPITGALRMVKEDGTISREYQKVWLQGGGFGMIKTGNFVEGMPVWFGIPSKEDPTTLPDEELKKLTEQEFGKTYLPRSLHTNSVVEMGLINGNELQTGETQG